MHSESSLVLELQALSSEASTDISTLLRKALVVAHKLGLGDFSAWIQHELKGYPDANEVPPYRTVVAAVRAKNPYHGLIPVLFEDQKIADALTNVPIAMPIGALQDLMHRDGEDGGHLEVPLSATQEALLQKLNRQGVNLPLTRVTGRSQIAAIIDVVRTTILEWALRLEKKGILGNGMGFTKKEKEQAARDPHIQIQNFQGVLGNVTESTVTQHLSMAVRTEDLESLKEYFRSQGVAEPDLVELETSIEQDPRPRDQRTLGPRVSKWIGRMVEKAAQGTWQVAVNTASNLLAQAIRTYYGL